MWLADLVTSPRVQPLGGFINIRQDLAVKDYGEYEGPGISFVDRIFQAGDIS